MLDVIHSQLRPTYVSFVHLDFKQPYGGLSCDDVRELRRRGSLRFLYAPGREQLNIYLLLKFGESPFQNYNRLTI